MPSQRHYVKPKKLTSSIILDVRGAVLQQPVKAIRSSQLPTRLHAGTYSAVFNYLSAIKATGSDDGPTLAKHMRATPLLDTLFPGAVIREDGRVMLDQYLMRNKTAKEATGPQDYAAVVATVPAVQAYRPMSEGGCPFVQAAK